MPSPTVDAALEPGSAAAPIEVVELREVADHARVSRLLADVWQTGEASPPIPTDVVRALSHTGGYVAGVLLEGRLVGASVGFLAGDGSLHSHISGVLPAARDRGVGLALKLHQREWAMQHGLPAVTWTYDPLLRRNAWFNLTKLGARSREYLPCFYGDMPDGLNAGDESDRLYVQWDVSSTAATAAAAGRREEPVEADLVADGAQVVLEDVRGRPVLQASTAPVLLVRIPRDTAALREADPATALAWRRALREVLVPLLEDGAVVTGMTRSGCYVVRA